MIWQLPDDRMGVRTAPILLLSRDDVARDIGLTSDQRQKTWEKIADLGRRATDLKGRNDKEVNVLRHIAVFLPVIPQSTLFPILELPFAFFLPIFIPLY